jgi:hypothetical protein
MKNNPKLVECGDHMLAPWCIVCVHIINGAATECVRLPMGPGEQDDWLCPTCLQKGPDAVQLDEVRCVCIHCARDLVKCLKQSP